MTIRRLNGIARALGISAVLLTATANASDSCASALCMYGLMTGTADSECTGPIFDYFKIVDFDWDGFDPNGTAKERAAYLASCPGTDNEKIEKISNLYGKTLGGGIF